MSAASMICERLTDHGETTRPQLQRQLGLHEKAVETAIRKLIRMGCVVDTRRTCREGGPRLSPIYALGPVKFDQDAFSRFDGERGRPRKACAPALAVHDLGLAIAAWRRLPEAA
ncbi:hypothetical protein WT09_30775 [Burkholderia stagnalis]|uniref:hypothetical protein n=1 Tax=Burkholderia stagnalis TaxID=1503054 RepID=UPI00075DE8D6|nr:hypothetical protein [Burkholderia stagnalis]KVN08210.1 hypothetical protein WT09_30775 [Burkholderia stagnalis]